MNAAQQEARSPNRAAAVERLLLGIAGGFLFVNFLAMGILNSSRGVAHWIHLIVWALCAFLGHRWLDRRLPGRDPFVFPLTMFLGGWGVLHHRPAGPGIC